MTSILGISAFYHDSAAALVEDGKIIGAVQEERFTRIKHDSAFPINGIKYLLKESGISLSDLDYVVYYDKPFLKFERLLETYVAFAPKGFKSFCKAMPIWLSEKLFQKTLLFNKLKQHDKNFNDKKKIMFSDHHLSHAASAYFPSPFNETLYPNCVLLSPTVSSPNNSSQLLLSTSSQIKTPDFFSSSSVPYGLPGAPTASTVPVVFSEIELPKFQYGI